MLKTTRLSIRNRIVLDASLNRSKELPDRRPSDFDMNLEPDSINTIYNITSLPATCYYTALFYCNIFCDIKVQSVYFNQREVVI